MGMSVPFFRVGTLARGPRKLRRMLERKAEMLEQTEPDIIATGNIGCMTQIASGTHIPVVHTAELLDWATGGPIPPALAGRSLAT